MYFMAKGFCILLFILVMNGSYANSFNCPPVDAKGKLRIDPAAIRILEQCMKLTPTTKSIYYNEKTKTYSPERELLHQKIISDILKNKPCQVDNPIAILTGGLPGAGKTTYLEKKMPWIKANNFLLINSDVIRTKLPEYKGWNTDSTQSEAKDVGMAVLDKLGESCKYNLVFDSTMSRLSFYNQFIAKLKALHYRIYIVYVETPLPVAIQRAQERYLTSGRYISKEYLARVEKTTLDTFHAIKDEVDGYIVIDGENSSVLQQGGEKMPSIINNH